MTTFAELFPELPQVDRAWEDRKARLMALTADERIAAMRAGELSYRELAHWSAARPNEVPRVGTGEGGAGEFEWIAMFEPDIAEHDEAAATHRRGEERYAATVRAARQEAGRRGALARAR